MLRDQLSVRITPLAYIMLALAVVILPVDWVVSWVLAMLVHEMSHIVAVLCCGGRILNVRFSHKGAQIESDSLTPAGQIVSALAGPAGGFLLIFLAQWVPKLALCAAIQSVFNLLPLSMFDGGRIIHGFLRLRLTDANADLICVRIDWIARVILCICCLYFARVLSWGMLAVVACVVTMRRIRLKIPCKRALKRVQ